MVDVQKIVELTQELQAVIKVSSGISIRVSSFIGRENMPEVLLMPKIFNEMRDKFSWITDKTMHAGYEYPLEERAVVGGVKFYCLKEKEKSPAGKQD